MSHDCIAAFDAAMKPIYELSHYGPAALADRDNLFFFTETAHLFGIESAIKLLQPPPLFESTPPAFNPYLVENDLSWFRL